MKKLIIHEFCKISMSILVISFSIFYNVTCANEGAYEKLKSTFPVGWQKLLHKNDSVSLFKKELNFGATLFPKSVLVEGENILDDKGIELILRTQNETVVLSQVEAAQSSSNQTEFVRSFDYSGANFIASLSATLTYDGLLKYDLEIRPKSDEPITLKSLDIVLSLKEAFATEYSKYLAYDFDKQKLNPEELDDSQGILEPGDEKKFSFTPALWVGSESVGIEWIAETNLHYSDPSSPYTHTLSNRDSLTSFKTSFISSEMLLGTNARYSFAFFFTPSRHKKEGWRKDYLVSATSVEDAIILSKERKDMNMLYLSSWVKQPVEYPGLPKPMKEYDVQYRENITRLNRNGIKFIPYSSLYILPSYHPEVMTNEANWKAANKRKGSHFWRDKSGKEKPILPVTLESKSLRNFLISQHLSYLSAYDADGIYFDVAQFWELEHTLKRFIKKQKETIPKDIDLAEILYFPMFAHYEFVKDYWTSSKAVNSNFLIIHHTGSNMPRYSAAYTDIVVIGESFSRFFENGVSKKVLKNGVLTYLFPQNYVPDYSKFIKEKFLISYNQSDGYSYMLLPQVVRFNKQYLDENLEKFINWSDSAIEFLKGNDLLIWDARISRESVNAYLFNDLQRLVRETDNTFKVCSDPNLHNKLELRLLELNSREYLMRIDNSGLAEVTLDFNEEFAQILDCFPDKRANDVQIALDDSQESKIVIPAQSHTIQRFSIH